MQFTDRSIFFRMLLALCLLSIHIFAVAQETEWSPVGPTNASVFAIEQSPSDPLNLLAGTFFGGVYATSDGGVNWQHLDSPFSNSTVFTLAYAPDSQDVIYAGTFNVGLYKTEDAGVSWTQLNNGLTGLSIIDVAIDPTSSDVVLTATDSSLFRSDDAGASWAEISIGGTDVPRVVAFDPTRSGHVYLGTLGGGVYRSTDGGLTFVQFSAGMGDRAVTSLERSPDNSRLYAGTTDGAFRLTLGDATWDDISFDLPTLTVANLVEHPVDGRALAATDTATYSLAPDADSWELWGDVPARVLVINPDASIIYVATTFSELVATTDDGENFFATSNGIQNAFAGALLAVAFEGESIVYAGLGNGVQFTSDLYSDDGGSTWISDEGFDLGVFGLTAHPTIPGTLFAGTERAGVWISEDWGVTWAQRSDGIVPPRIFSLSQSPVDSNTLYAGTSAGLYVSRDDGDSWDSEGDISLSLPVLAVEADPVSLGVAYASLPGGVYKTITDGQSFQIANTGLPVGDSVSDLAIAPFGNVYAVTTSGQLYASDSEGASWFLSGTGIAHSVTAVATDPVLPWKGYVATIGGGVYRTTSEGIQWDAINNGLTIPFVSSIAVDSNDGLVLYAGSAGTVFKSVDGGDNWLGSDAGLPTDALVTALEVDNNNSQIIYASVEDQGVYKSSDGGLSWQLNASGAPFTGSLPIAVSQQTADKIFVGTAIEGVHASVNGGDSFQSSSSGMSLFVRSVVIDPANPDVFYAASLVGGVFKSTDGGLTWQSKGLTERNLFEVALHPTDADQVYVATSKGVAFSRDGGETWTDVGQRSPFALSMVVNPSDRNRVYIGSPAGKVFGSTDGGRSWSSLDQGLPVANIIALTIDPDSDELYASAERIGVYKSSDGGLSWSSTGALPADTQVSSLAVNENGRIFAATNGAGLFVSDDGGQNWVLTGLEDRDQIYNLSFDVQDNSRVYASTSLGIVRSNNDGNSWLDLGQQSLFVFDLITDPVAPAVLYAGGASGELFKSLDGGRAWQKLNDGLPSANILALALDSVRDTLYAGTENQGVFKSVDGGSSWQPTGNGISAEQVTSLAVDESNGRVHAGTNGSGIYTSDDNGASWTSSTTGLDSLIVSSVVNDPALAGRVYATTISSVPGDRGVYVSSDGGATWLASASGITTSTVNDVTVSTSQKGVLYAATLDGVFRSDNAAGSWAPANNGLGNVEILSISIESRSDRLIATGADQRIYTSSDGGSSWSAAAMNGAAEDLEGIVAGTAGRLYANTLGGGILISDDSGDSWEAAIVPDMVNEAARTVINDPSAGDALYASIETVGVVKSTDGGGRWTVLNGALASGLVTELFVNPADSQTLLAATLKSGVFKSVDGGDLWASVDDPYGGFRVTEFAAGIASDRVFAASIDYGLLTSDDSGGVWQGGIVDSQAEPVVSEIALHPTDTGTLYAAASGVGLLKSTDGGASWDLVSESFGNQFILAIAIDPQDPDVVYAGTGDGVYVTEDGGETWTLLGGGLFNTNITALTLDPLNSRIVYVGTEGGGVFRIDRTLPPVDSDGDFVPDSEDCAPDDPRLSTLHAYFHDYEQDSFGINRVEPMIPDDFFIETAVDVCAMAPELGFVPFTGDPWDFDGFQYIETVDKNERQLAVDFSFLAEDSSFPDDRLIDLGVDATSLQLFWNSIESSPGVYDGPQATALPSILEVYSSRNLKMSLTISSISSRFLTAPEDLVPGIMDGSIRMSDANVIQRYKDVLTHVHSELAGIDIMSVQLGHEVDKFVAEITVPGFWTDYGVFYSEVFEHAKILWGADVPVSSTFSVDGFLDPDFAPLLDIFQFFDDVLSLSYLPVHDDFTIFEPEEIYNQLETVADAAAVLAKPIFLQSVAYPTASAVGSSTTKQSQFLFEFFRFWDVHHEEIPFVSFGALHDISFESAQAQIDAGQFDTTIDLTDELARNRLAAYLSSFGLRTYEGSGEHKSGFNTLRNMAFDRGWFRDIPKTERRYHMGFTTAAYDFPTEEEEQIEVSDWLRDRLKKDSDITLLHFDGGVPWVEAFADDFSSPELPYSDAVNGTFLKNREDIPAGSKVVVAINPLGVPRQLLAPYWGFGEGFDYDEDFNRIPNGQFTDDEQRFPPFPWNTYSFGNAEVQTAYLNYCKRILQYFDPDYLVMGIEVSAALEQDVDAYEEYFELHKFVYNTLKADPEFKHIPLMVSFSATSYMIDEFGVAYKYDEQLPGVRAAQLDAFERFLPYTDIIGLSYYPHFGKYSAYTMQAMLYDELFDMLDRFGAGDKPIAFAESGFTADPYNILDGFLYLGSEEKQLRYFKLLFRELARRSNPVEYIINFKVRDSDLGWQRQVDALDPDSPPGTADFVEFLKFFRDIGIYDGDGALRSGGVVWKEQLELPYLPIVDPADQLMVESPSGELSASFEMGVTRKPYFTLMRGNQNLMAASPLGMLVDGVSLGERNTTMTATEPVTVMDSFNTLGAKAYAEESYSEFTLIIEREDRLIPEYEIDVRLYENAMAFRYKIPGTGTREISGEDTAWNIPHDSLIWAQHDLVNFEGEYARNTIDELTAPSGLPVTLELPNDGGYMLISEADLKDYSGMVLTIQNPGSSLMRGQFPFEATWSVEGGSTSPWRVVVYSDDLNGLVNSNVIASLNPDPDPMLFDEGPLSDWIKPGRAVWPGFLNADTGFDLNFQLGQVEYAGILGFDYVLVDPGWEVGFPFYGYPDAFSALADLVTFAKSDGRDVDIIVWKPLPELYEPLERQAFLQSIAGAGAAGVRVDFVSSETQFSLGIMEEVRREAAELELLVTFDRVGKPTGESRTHPNELTRAAVRGLGWEGGVDEVTPAHNTALPFTRGLAGSTDYKVVGLNAANRGATTFVHQLAMAGLLVSPLQTWALDQTNAGELQNAIDVIKEMPTVWDETVVLEQSEIGELAAIARRSGRRWFLFVANGDTSGTRVINDIDLSFLRSAYYDAVMLSDLGADGIKRETVTGISNQYGMTITMETGGGFVAMLTSSRAPGVPDEEWDGGIFDNVKP
ncbi:MAG: glycoside hydrolase family 97 N-terminal domain-containing protein [Gammaproteobacteria bacterium]